ncbi:MAG: hypothetical protein LBT59_19905 [Clostridiales bacterium]|jgi:hypothetical protein|nr:hypothetical protein [Clostridiales bacterium]
MLESMIVFVLTMFLLLFILSFFTALCQFANIQVIANETASRTAQLFAYQDSDFLSGSIGMDSVVAVDLYKYIFSFGDLESSAIERASEYANKRIKSTSLAIIREPPVINVEFVNDAMSRRHAKVTISGKYDLLFGGAMEYFGLGEYLDYTHVAYADCKDLMDYMNTVDFLDDMSKQSSQLTKTFDAVTKLINSVMSAFLKH